jgi:hypothetical protein
MDLDELKDANELGLDEDMSYGDKVGEEQNVTADGGVKKKILKAGEGWEKPEKGDEVSGKTAVIACFENLPHRVLCGSSRPIRTDGLKCFVTCISKS